MNKSLAGQDGREINIKCRAVVVRNFAPRFFDDQNGGRHIPGSESLFPETVEAAARDISKIEGGRSIAPYPLRIHDEICKVACGLSALADIVRENPAQTRRN